jgi:putrescine aminotransferase
LVERTAGETAPALAAMLARLDGHPLVGEIRAIGGLGAIEIVAEPGTNRRFSPEGSAAPILRDACVERGLMVRAVRDTVIMCPPLVITTEEIGRMGDILAAALDATAKILRKVEIAG